MFGEVLDAHLSVTSSPSTCSCAGVRGGINAKGWGGGLERGGLVYLQGKVVIISEYHCYLAGVLVI